MPHGQRGGSPRYFRVMEVARSPASGIRFTQIVDDPVPDTAVDRQLRLKKKLSDGSNGIRLPVKANE